MSDFFWVVHDEAGSDIRTTERFETKAEAEEWMGREWSGLLTEGGESVSLFEGERKHYQMGLRAE